MTELAAPTALEFTVLGAEPIEHSATPGVRFHLHIGEPEGREVYTIALSTQIQIDPARRSYDDATRARLVELFGAPDRWGATTHALQWTRIESLVPSFTGSTAFTLEVPCTYDLEVASAKYFDSLPEGEVPLTFHFNGTVLYRGRRRSAAGRARPVELLVALADAGRRVEAHDRRPLPGRRLDPPAARDAGGALAAQGGARAALVRRHRAGAAVSVDRLLSTLLYEGYALYPYTPGATKNATPTPFGIVYPPVYAAGGPHTFDRARMQVVLEPGAGDRRSPGRSPSSSRAASATRAWRAGSRCRPTRRSSSRSTPCRAACASRRRRSTAGSCACRCASTTPPRCRRGSTAPARCGRRCSPRTSSRSAPGGRFASPVAPGPTAAAAVRACDHVNIFPVLATDNDDTVLGASIVLPDHPQIAPESHGDLFDATEIEEALLLHVLALSDAERAAIAEQDPKVREMLARAEAAGPDAIARLHGRVTVTDLPPAHRPGPADVAGERAIEVGGVVFRRGAKVRLRPGFGAAPQDGVWAGRLATIERIYRDYEDGVHLAVTVDDDPGQELMRDIGRYLYFKPAEVEVVPA